MYKRGVTRHDPTKAYQGLNLYIDPSRSPALGRIVLMGMDGNDVQTWPSPFAGADQPTHVEPVDGGGVLAIFQDAVLLTESVVEMDWDGNVVWQYSPPPGTGLHHDLERLENGNTLLLASQSITEPSIGPNPFFDDVIQEVDPSGQVVWEWSTAAHFAVLPYADTEEVYIWLANRQLKTNLFHSNGISVLPPNAHEAQDPRFAAGNILVSQRDTSTVLLIERTTGDMVWFYKGAIGQHEPHMLDLSLPGAGNILMLDNGGEAGYPTVSRLYSQVVELDPTAGLPVWTYDATDSNARRPESFFSPWKGGAQRLPNGNTLIVEAIWGRAFEVTASGEVVWEFVLPADRDVYRLYRVEPTWPPVAPLERPRRRY